MSSLSGMLACSLYQFRLGVHSNEHFSLEFSWICRLQFLFENSCKLHFFLNIFLQSILEKKKLQNSNPSFVQSHELCEDYGFGINPLDHMFVQNRQNKHDPLALFRRIDINDAKLSWNLHLLSSLSCNKNAKQVTFLICQ
eukprot:TRINITY_DN12105_c0_g1_i3.p1 TRINITY_DN12105_c0_g1~~TRINITY_DN12105_c0_g1_i3.p1  ORF type:complete len:140 (-),score=12.26 TRINITY_DN12105_c0_g1_i3:81-500(-)